MPLSKARMRERKKQDRAVKPASNLTNAPIVKPEPQFRPNKYADKWKVKVT